MGMLTRMQSLGFIITTIFICSILVFLYFLNKKNVDAHGGFFGVELSGSKIIHTFIVFGAFLAITWINFNPSLHGDELSHSFYSQYHIFYALTKLAPWLSAFDISKLIWVSSFSVVITICLLLLTGFKFLKKFRFENKIPLIWLWVAIIFLIVSRVLLHLVGGFDPAHPPFRLFPLWLSSSLFGLTDLSFRLPGLIALSLIVVTFYDELKTAGQPVVICIMGLLAVSSIPVLWSSSYIVEPSIWAALFSTIFLFKFQRNSLNLQDFKLLVAILSVFILMRQSIIYVLPALFFLMIVQHRTDAKRTVTEYLLVLTPLLIALPMLFRSIVLGTPAQNYSDVEEQLSVIDAISLAWSSGLLFKISWSNLGWWLIFLIFALVPSKKWGMKGTISICIMLLSGIFLFYSIRPILWGIPRYHVEFLVPIILFGLVRFLSLNLMTGLKGFVLAIFIGLNCYQMFAGSQVESIVNGHKSIETHPRYDFRGALALAKNSGLAGKTVIFNGNYRRMLEIMSGFSVGDLELLSRLDEDLKNGLVRPSVKALVHDERVELVLVGRDNRDPEIEGLIQELEDAGFKVWDRFDGGWRYQTVVGYIRN